MFEIEIVTINHVGASVKVIVGVADSEHVTTMCLAAKHFLRYTNDETTFRPQKTYGDGRHELDDQYKLVADYLANKGAIQQFIDNDERSERLKLQR